MSSVAILSAVVGILALPLLVTGFRQRSLVTMALRNVGRRRGEAALIVLGAVLGTAIITSSFIVGDILGGSIKDGARTQLGPVDITVSPADSADLAKVLAAIEEADFEAVDGLLTVQTATMAIQASGSGAVLPRALVMEVNQQEARAFGGDPYATGLTDLEASPGMEGIVLNDRSAGQLEVVPGDQVRLHAYGAEVPLVVTDVLPEVGLAGFAGAMVDPGFLDRLSATATSMAAPPRAQLLVSLTGGVFDTRQLSEKAVGDLRGAVDAIPGVEVAGVKANLLDQAERTEGTFTGLFGMIGAFSVLAGILLLINLFVMLAEERKSELGMLRAIGFTRQRLIQTFAMEGALYASMAAIVGALAGIGIGWLVAVASMTIFGLGDQGFALQIAVEPTSVLVGALTGLGISLLTIWLTSWRIARLNVIRAIRDLPDPISGNPSRRPLIIGAFGVLAGIVVSGAGYSGTNAIPFLIGVPAAAYSATPMLRRLVPERTARMLVGATVVGWGLAAFELFPNVMGAVELPVFVAQGVVLTAGAVTLAATLDGVWTTILKQLTSRGRGLAARLSLAYPLARRLRTSMLLSMFALVVFTMALISAITTSQRAQSQFFTDEVRGGYDVIVDSNPANPIDAASLEGRADVETVAGLARTFAYFESSYVEEPRAWAITGIDEDLMASQVPALSSRADTYPSDLDVYRAVVADPALAIVDENFLQDGAPSGDRMRPGDTFIVIEPSTGKPRQLIAAAITTSDWVFNGVMVSRQLTSDLFGPQDVAARHYLTVAAGHEPEMVVEELNAALLANGVDAATFTTIVDTNLEQQTSFYIVLQAFLGLGLLVGVAGLGVVMFRAVRERRREIGMLRAIGFRSSMVRATFLYEAGMIALQGTVIGVVLGLVTARQMMMSSEAFGDTQLVFTMPWLGVTIIALVPILASLAATVVPASRAAATHPAAAIRVAD
jgi:putative ABC transport system permease protein